MEAENQRRILSMLVCRFRENESELRGTQRMDLERAGTTGGSDLISRGLRIHHHEQDAIHLQQELAHAFLRALGFWVAAQG